MPIGCRSGRKVDDMSHPDPVLPWCDALHPPRLGGAVRNASKADAELGFMARMLALSSLPSSNPGNRSQHIRRN